MPKDFSACSASSAFKRRIFSQARQAGRDSGSERGPVALPVFKIGRAPRTRGGWVRLPGASAIPLADFVFSRAESLVTYLQGAKNLCLVAEVPQHHIGIGRTQGIDVVTAGRHGDRSRTG